MYSETLNHLKSYALHIGFLLLTLLWIYPLIWTITSSLKETRELYSGSLALFPERFSWDVFMPKNWGLINEVFHFENYARAWYIADFSKYFINTVIFTVVVVTIVTILCCMSGYVLGRYSFPGRFVFIGAVSATMFIPHGYTIIPIWQLINGLGLNESLIGLVLAEVGGAHVLYILLFTAYFRGIPKELEEAAEMDGAGFMRTFITVMVPLSKPVIATVTIMQFIHTWNSFFIPLVFTVHRPDLRTLSVGLYSFVEEYSSDLAGMAAGATISFIPIIIVFLFFQKYFVEGISGAVKG
jgi:ABC-type glycerol-3-phosphate transport system permease component